MNLNVKLVGSLGIIALAACGLILVNVVTLSSLLGDAARMNLFGLGRAYPVQISALIDDIFDDNSNKRASARANLQKTIKLAGDRFDALLNGNPSQGIPAADNPEIIKRLRTNVDLWSKKIQPLLEEILSAPSKEKVQNAIESVAGKLETLGAVANEVIDRETEISRARVYSVQLLQYAFLGVLIIIFFIVRWITRGVVRTIADTTNSLASASSELLAGTAQQSASAQEQAAAVAETIATVEEVNQTAEQAAQRAKAVADSAQRAAEISKAGRQAVDESVASMATVKDQTGVIAENILALAERAQAIGEIIATVNDVAEQTNLLALNAGIEAARAGEHGAGFTVVAREIKDLAAQAKKATAQVRQILGEIQKATNSAVMVTEEGSKSVNATIKAVNRAGETIRTLATTVDEAATAANQITASAAQQATGMSQIQQAMRDINQATNQNLASTKQAERAAQDLNALGVKLNKLLAR